MSHFRQKTFMSITAFALLAATGPAVTAQAGINEINNPGLKTPLGKSQTQTAALSDFTRLSEKPVLDWRNQNYSLTFDVPDMNWTSLLRLSLSADPVGNIPRNAEIYVQFNQEPPVKISTKGRGFDALLTLETASIRPRNNVLNIFYGVPAGAECLQSQNGAWVLNLDRSILTLRSRTKSRALNIGDIDAVLSNPLIAPQNVSLIAFGDHQTQFQSLLAQAVGLRSAQMPEFTLSLGTGDIEFIAGRREVISRHIKNKVVLQVSGPRVALDEGRPLRVILTGDTDEEVLHLLQAFAQHRLPETRRTLTSTGELRMQRPLSEDTALRSGQTKLSDLGSMDIHPNWNPSNASLRFDVEDPIASRGDILLRLAAPKAVAHAENTLTLSLNGKSIGQTPLDKRNKSVAFQIPKGALQGQDNVLKMTSDIETENLNGCLGQSYSQNSPTFGKHSRITLTSETETPLSDLSRLTATGAPFSDANGKETLLVLPKNNADYQAALGLLAKLAAKQGAGWTEAEVTRDYTQVETLARQRNVLFILPAEDIPQKAKSAAPKSFLSALTGKSQDGENLLTAEAERYASAASLGGSFAFKNAQRNRIANGGVAALYASPYQFDKIAGVITNIPGDSFGSALENLSQSTHWNRLEGSVARWNDKTVLMTELSLPLPKFVRSIRPAPSSGYQLDWPEIDFAAVRFALPDLKWPSVNWGELKEKATFWENDNVVTDKEHQSAVSLRGLSVVETGDISQTPKNGVHWTGNKWSSLKASFLGWGLNEKVSNLQSRAQQLKSTWRQNWKRSSIPGRYAENWSLQQLSAAAFLGILLLGMILLSFSKPRNRANKYY
jgi:hypothetical protein